MHTEESGRSKSRVQEHIYSNLKHLKEKAMKIIFMLNEVQATVVEMKHTKEKYG